MHRPSRYALALALPLVAFVSCKKEQPETEKPV